MTCQKCMCVECNGTGYIKSDPCWACGEEEHTCIPFEGQRLLPPPGTTKPYTAAELRQLERTLGSQGSIPYVIGRLLSTIRELNASMDKVSGVRETV